jgi:hypothetical protein
MFPLYLRCAKPSLLYPLHAENYKEKVRVPANLLAVHKTGLAEKPGLWKQTGWGTRIHKEKELKARR